VAAIAIAAGGRFAPLADAAAAASLVVLAIGLAFRSAATVPWAVLLAAVAYLAGREGSAAVDGRAAGVGVLLLLAAELATWSADEHPRLRPDRAVVLRRVFLLGALAAAAFLVDVLVLAASGLSTSGGTPVAAVGTAAAVAALALAVRAGR